MMWLFYFEQKWGKFFEYKSRHIIPEKNITVYYCLLCSIESNDNAAHNTLI